MSEQTLRPFKMLLLEMAIYVTFIAGYITWNWYSSSSWFVNRAFQFGSRIWPHNILPAVNMQIALVLGLLILAVVLFAFEYYSVDIVTLVVLIGLVTTGILTPAEAFAGFSNDIIIILASIFVISSALQHTGAMDAAGAYLLKAAGTGMNRLMVMLMAVVGGMSMFMNNTTATAIFIPPAISIANRVKISPSKLLMPLAFASILGGTSTLIGTSTNVAVSGYITQLGLEPVGLFELMPIGLIMLGVGILYIVTVSKHLLPDHKVESLAEDYAIRKYLSEVVVIPDSELIGQKIFESDLAKLDFRILAVVRGDRKFRPNSRSKVEEGDTLLVQGRVDELMKVKETAGIDIKSDAKWDTSDWQGNGESEEIKLAEVLVVPQSDLIGRTLKSTSFLQRYGVTVLAIYRHGQTLGDKIGRIRLRLGDLLLIQGPLERLEFLRRSADFWVLEEISPLLYQKRKSLYTIIILAAAVIAGGLGWLPLSIAFLAAAVLVILTRCISLEEAYQFIDWRLIILIGGMTAFGVAMEKTGAAEFLADLVVTGLEPLGVMAIMAGFFVLTILLTQPMSNAAAALVVLPVALHAAQRLEVNERTFAIAIMVAASISLITPFEPSCLLVYGSGKYKFMDFVKTGGGLTLLLMVLALFLVPVFWPL